MGLIDRAAMSKQPRVERTVAVPLDLYEQIEVLRATLSTSFGRPTVKAVVAGLLRKALGVKPKRGRA